MDFTTRQLVVIVLISAVFSKISTAPSQSQPAPGGVEVLHNIIIELENVLYKLKDYARSIQTTTSQKESQVSDKASEVDLNELRAVISKSGQSSASVDKTKAKTAPLSADSSSSDVSLREALEYLVALAKEKKVERRDHDIPFPVKEDDSH